MKFQKSKRHQSESPNRRGARSVTPKHSRRNLLGRFTPNPTGETKRWYGYKNNRDNQHRHINRKTLFIPNLFVNSAEEGEIENSMEMENNEGNVNLEIKTEEQNEQNNNTEKFTERRSERNRRRPNYYGAIKYC